MSFPPIPLMMSDPPLDRLCTICYTHKHKYRCPRCLTETCSLPCTRLHKRRAECSGLRNPAAYLPRSELATPKGIDHDYNYLSGIERAIERADRDCNARGIQPAALIGGARGDAASTRGGRRAGHTPKGEVPLRQALARCGVRVVKAPVGMSRAKSNHTRWVSKRRQVLWTVEWVHPDGRKEVGECNENDAIGESYRELVAERERKAQGYRPRKMRKQQQQQQCTKGETEEQKPLSLCDAAPVNGDEDGDPDPIPNPNSSFPLPPLPQDKPAEEQPPPPVSSREKPGMEQQPTTDSTEATVAEAKPAAETEAESADPAAKPEAGFSFHLHIPLPPFPVPQQPSDSHSDSNSDPLPPSRHLHLQPLQPSSTLASSLNGRVVLEYPTIYVFRQHDASKAVCEAGTEAEAEAEAGDQASGSRKRRHGEGDGGGDDDSKKEEDGDVDDEDGREDEGRLGIVDKKAGDAGKDAEEGEGEEVDDDDEADDDILGNEERRREIIAERSPVGAGARMGNRSGNRNVNSGVDVNIGVDIGVNAERVMEVLGRDLAGLG